MRHAAEDRRVKTSTVCAGLSAGDDFGYGHGLWHRESVVAVWMIGPVRVVKVNSAIVHAIGSHGHPDTIGQIRAGLHHDQATFGLGNVEAKAIDIHSKVFVLSLDQWIPQHRGSTSMRWSPAGRPQLVIHGDIIGIPKHEGTKKRGVPLKVNAGQEPKVSLSRSAWAEPARHREPRRRRPRDRQDSHVRLRRRQRSLETRPSATIARQTTAQPAALVRSRTIEGGETKGR